MMRALIPALVLALGSLVGSAVASAPLVVAFQEDESEAALIEKLRTEREAAEPEVFTKLVRARSAAGGRALVEVYDTMASVGGKLRTIEALPHFAEVAEVGSLVLDKLTDIAANDPLRSLRFDAVEALGRSRLPGRDRLRTLVEAPIEDEVRIAAMRRHIAEAKPADAAWYRALWKPEEAASNDSSKRRRKGDEEPLEARRLVDVRRLAFEGLAPQLTALELVEALTTEGAVNVRLALRQLRERSAAEGGEMAERLFRTLEVDPLVRVEAAKYLMDLRGADFLDDVEKFGTNRASAPILREELAALYARVADERTLAKLARNVGKGKAEEKIFYTLACVKHVDGKLDATLRKLIEDKELAVRLVAMQVVVARSDRGALEALEKRLASSDDDIELANVLEAISRLREGEMEWTERVRTMVASEQPRLRHAAVRELARREDVGAVEVLGRALDSEDWATRFVAIEALGALRVEAAIPLLIERLPKESGRLETAVADVLFKLTGQPFQRRAPAWAAWWRDNGAGFECITEQELRTLQREREAERREQRTGATEFFGVVIDSSRVVFVLDISGSMEERVLGRYAGQRGETRLTVARAEIARFLESLAVGASFNIITFSDRIMPWRRNLVRKDAASLAAANEAIGKLIASGATDVYGALEAAFADPETDTIILLSDGEPTAGEVTDLTRIRSRVQAWNEHRGVVIHTVQIGATFELLQWLAEDSGGDTVLIP